MQKLYIDQLAIEVTRRCNMSCPHCLRGDAEDIDIDLAYVDRLFSMVGSVGELTITGGEPSIAPAKLKGILRLAKKHKVSVGSFYLVTNALKVSKPFLSAVFDWYLYCNDNESTGLAYSADVFHDEVPYLNIEKLKVFSFAHEKHKITEEHLVRQGRAALYYDCKRDPAINSYGIDGRRVEGMVYLNCKGSIVSDCDISYENQDDKESFWVCNILDVGDLIVALEEYNERVG